jgi:hypothetical protein
LAYQSSINALRELLKPEDKGSYYHSASSTHCHITKRQELSFTEDGQEYCFVQVTCDDGVQYGIQAFGDEAVELYKETKKSAISV